MVKTCERLEQNSKDLPYLHQGDTVFIQNQDQSHGKPNKWDREGTIVEVGDNDQYLVRVHGTGRVTLRNRRFLRKFQPTSQIFQYDFPVAVSNPVHRGMPDVGQKGTPDLVPLDQSTQSQPQEPVLQPCLKMLRKSSLFRQRQMLLWGNPEERTG